jgi:hypothetical protein
MESPAVFPQALEIAVAITTFPPHRDCYTHSQTTRKEQFLSYQLSLPSRLILRLEKSLQPTCPLLSRPGRRRQRQAYSFRNRKLSAQNQGNVFLDSVGRTRCPI